MCGRFAASAATQDIIATFGVEEVVDEPLPTFNAAPTDPVPAVVDRLDRDTGQPVRKLVTPRWGLVPSWSKDARGGARMINARSETVATKPAFRKALAARRCLIPADGYYEWEAVEEQGRTVKQPWFIRPADRGPFVMAGLYEFWRDPSVGPEGPWLTTCTVLTAQATDALGRVHDRMPLSVPADHWSDWLDPALQDGPAALSLLHRLDGDEVATWPVSRAVSSVHNDGPGLIQPLA